MFLEFLCCALSFGFYEIRRAKIILAFCVINCIVNIFGIYAKLVLSMYGLLGHAMYSISFVGGFYIYIMIDYAIRGGGI